MQQCLAFVSWHCCWLYRSPLSATVARRPRLSLLCIGIHNIWDSCMFSTWCDTVRNIQCVPVKLADSQVNLLHTTTATKNNNGLLLQAVDGHVLHSSAIYAGRSLATLLPVVFFGAQHLPRRLIHSSFLAPIFTVRWGLLVNQVLCLFGGGVYGNQHLLYVMHLDFFLTSYQSVCFKQYPKLSVCVFLNILLKTVILNYSTIWLLTPTLSKKTIL